MLCRWILKFVCGQHSLLGSGRRSSFRHASGLHCMSALARSDARFIGSKRGRSHVLLLWRLRGDIFRSHISVEDNVLVTWKSWFFFKRKRWEVEMSHWACQICNHKLQRLNFYRIQLIWIGYKSLWIQSSDSLSFKDGISNLLKHGGRGLFIGKPPLWKPSTVGPWLGPWALT